MECFMLAIAVYVMVEAVSRVVNMPMTKLEELCHIVPPSNSTIEKQSRQDQKISN